MNYFSQFFNANPNSDTDAIIDAVKSCVTTQMNSSLLEIFTEVEVKQVVFQMYPTKVHGSNGMSPQFFFLQKLWHIVGGDVSHAIINFLSTSHMIRKINFTHVVVIPKVKNSEI